jgi:glutathione S-transferase
MGDPRPILWGSELSPFALKVRALLAHARVEYDWLPAEGGWLRNFLTVARIDRAKRTRRVQRYPQTSELDEYPLVPYLLAGDRVLYDSSGIARYLDDTRARGDAPVVPREPLTGFLVRLIDEAFDEFGLYLVHHNRWVNSAATNDAGLRLAREFASMLPPFTGQRFARSFAERQVRRLPYLCSVAEPGYAAPLPPALVPPAREGFPPTHALLDRAWGLYVDALDEALGRHPYLFGGRFTVADASIYGQLGMNLADPTTNQHMRARVPRVHRWLVELHGARGLDGAGALVIHEALTPLLRIIGRTFVPLMVQNEAAYRAARDAGETSFNERAFDHGRALYDGALLGRPFRSVVKTFQVQVWRELQASFEALDHAEQARAADLLAVAAATLRPGNVQPAASLGSFGS